MASSDTHAGDLGHSSHPDSFYIKIWGVLMVLLLISIIGPELGSRLNLKVVTLITAFGIAIVKAYLVIKNFMHLGVERKWVGYLLVTMVALMVLMVGGVGPDVLRHEGTRWQNAAAIKAVENGMEHDAPHDEAHPPAH